MSAPYATLWLTYLWRPATGPAVDSNLTCRISTTIRLPSRTLVDKCPVSLSRDTFLIGNWPEHLGVHVCAVCHALANIPVETGHWSGCGQQPDLQDFYDYSFAVPYLGGQMPGQPEPGHVPNRQLAGTPRGACLRRMPRSG